MGRYVNPGNEGFAEILQGRYVDKTGLISIFDSTLNVAGQKLVMVSRPRRFGKSYAAHALAAFYSCGCDSRALFEGLTFTPEVVAGAYMTGILPIKKYNHQSAVSDFREYTMVAPVAYAPTSS